MCVYINLTKITLDRWEWKSTLHNAQANQKCDIEIGFTLYHRQMLRDNNKSIERSTWNESDKEKSQLIVYSFNWKIGFLSTFPLFNSSFCAHIHIWKWKGERETRPHTNALTHTHIYVYINSKICFNLLSWPDASFQMLWKKAQLEIGLWNSLFAFFFVH